VFWASQQQRDRPVAPFSQLRCPCDACPEKLLRGPPFSESENKSGLEGKAARYGLRENEIKIGVRGTKALLTLLGLREAM